MYLFLYKLFFIALRCAPYIFFVASVVTSLGPRKTSAGLTVNICQQAGRFSTFCSLACPANLAVGQPAGGSGLFLIGEERHTFWGVLGCT
jgi:hypothetical protein